MDYDYEIVYRLDKDNKVVGALPRLDCRSQLFSIILLLSTFQIIKQIKIENISSPELQGIHTILVQQPRKNLKFKIKDEREKFFLGHDSAFKNIVLTEYHSRPIGGHAGVAKIYSRLCTNFIW